MRHKYPGTKIGEGDQYGYETFLSVDKLFRNSKMKELIKPTHQGALDDMKVDEMRKEYKSNPHIFRSKNKIVVVDLDDRWYLVDGQHRYDMIKQEFEDDKNIQEQIQISWFKFSHEEELIELYKSLNQDSIKNKNYISMNSFKMIKVNEFMNKLSGYHESAFAKRKNPSGYVKAVEELRDELNEAGFFDSNDIISLTSDELYEYFIDKNYEFANLIDYSNNFVYNETIFYEKEKNLVKNNIVFTLNRNNFVKWLCNKDSSAIHHYRKQKQKIPSAIRTSVWRSYYGVAEEGICPISYCNAVITRTKSPGMHCGHIISEKNGGTIEAHNLRPLCSKCNCEMSYLNWEDFDKESYETMRGTSGF